MIKKLMLLFVVINASVQAGFSDMLKDIRAFDLSPSAQLCTIAAVSALCGIAMRFRKEKGLARPAHISIANDEKTRQAFPNHPCFRLEKESKALAESIEKIKKLRADLKRNVELYPDGAPGSMRPEVMLCLVKPE